MSYANVGHTSNAEQENIHYFTCDVCKNNKVEIKISYTNIVFSYYTNKCFFINIINRLNKILKKNLLIK